MLYRPTALSSFILIAFLLGFASASGAEPGWSPVIVATGRYGEQIRSLPLERRPYRPLHFYGNTVRRLHYRGTPLPDLRRLSEFPTRLLLRSPGLRPRERP